MATEEKKRALSKPCANQVTWGATCKLAPSLFLSLVCRPTSKYLASPLSSPSCEAPWAFACAELPSSPMPCLAGPRHPVTCSISPLPFFPSRLWGTEFPSTVLALLSGYRGPTGAWDPACRELSFSRLHGCSRGHSPRLPRARPGLGTPAALPVARAKCSERPCRAWLCLISVSSRSKFFPMGTGTGLGQPASWAEAIDPTCCRLLGGGGQKGMPPASQTPLERRVQVVRWE